MRDFSGDKINRTTRFASPERSGNDAIRAEHELVRSLERFEQIFNSISAVAAVINENRQIIYANREFLKMLGTDDLSSVLGKRPGETLQCIHAETGEYGCGTAESCRVCGAVHAVLECRESGAPVVREARISAITDGRPVSLDMLVTATPFPFDGRRFIAVTFRDIGPQKHREKLEHIFFHDILNTVATLKSALNLVTLHEDGAKKSEFISMAHKICESLLDEIESQHKLIDAENNALRVQPRAFGSIEILREVAGRYDLNAGYSEKEIILDDGSRDEMIFGDPVLVRRILINMLKNALEATPAGGAVTMGCRAMNETVRFHVHNAGVIPRDAQLQVFQRSFSTKGSNRGFGTYSMRLLAEHYLKGKVYFESSESGGTTFFLEIPVDFPAFAEGPGESADGGADTRLPG